MTLDEIVETFGLYDKLLGLYPPVNAIRYFHEDVLRRGYFEDIPSFLSAYEVYRLKK